MARLEQELLLHPTEYIKIPVEKNGFLIDCEHAERAFAKGRDAFEGYEFEAGLPDVIGYIPPNERDYFDNLPSTNDAIEILRGENLNEILANMPGLHNLILEDLEKIGKFEIFNLEYEKKFRQKGGSPRGSIRWHFDDIRQGEYLPRYVMSNNEPTQFYNGPANVGAIGDRLILLDTISEKAPYISVPKYSIARLAPLTIHRTPKFTTDSERVFMRIDASKPK
jgi:hypothetical protein